MSSTPALDKFNEKMRKRYGITPEQSFQEMERLRSRARHNEASALYNAEQKEREKWQGVVADISAKLADKDAKLADKDAKLADKDAENEKLRLQIAELQAQIGKK